MSKHHDRIKNDPRYKAARRECFERDGYACVDCGAGAQLEADHVTPLHVIAASNSWDLAWLVDNLATRCKPCNISRFHASAGEVRQQWVNPNYPEVLEALGRDS